MRKESVFCFTLIHSLIREAYLKNSTFPQREVLSIKIIHGQRCYI